jgi:hypothetical protein
MAICKVMVYEYWYESPNILYKRMTDFAHMFPTIVYMLKSSRPMLHANSKINVVKLKLLITCLLRSAIASRVHVGAVPRGLGKHYEVVGTPQPSSSPPELQPQHHHHASIAATLA